MPGTENNPSHSQSLVHQKLEDRLIERLNPLIAPLGYEIVHLETLVSRQKTLRLFIDFSKSGDSEDSAETVTGVTSRKIGIQDCIIVNRALEEPLDQMAELESLFKGPYELEVSSPGVDRPLRTQRDYLKFSGHAVRIHTFRPLTGEELENGEYQILNPKQKNFIGSLVGFQDQKVLISVPMGKLKTQVRIPISLVSKSNLEPEFESPEKRSKS